MSCDTPCASPLVAAGRYGAMLKGSVWRSNRRINITAAASRAEEGKHQDLDEHTRRPVLKS